MDNQSCWERDGQILSGAMRRYAAPRHVSRLPCRGARSGHTHTLTVERVHIHDEHRHQTHVGRLGENERGGPLNPRERVKATRDAASRSSATSSSSPPRRRAPARPGKWAASIVAGDSHDDVDPASRTPLERDPLLSRLASTSRSVPGPDSRLGSGALALSTTA